MSWLLEFHFRLGTGMCPAWRISSTCSETVKTWHPTTTPPYQEGNHSTNRSIGIQVCGATCGGCFHISMCPHSLTHSILSMSRICHIYVQNVQWFAGLQSAALFGYFQGCKHGFHVPQCNGLQSATILRHFWASRCECIFLLVQLHWETSFLISHIKLIISWGACFRTHLHSTDLLRSVILLWLHLWVVFVRIYKVWWHKCWLNIPAFATSLQTSGMFNGAASFNQPITFDVSGVTGVSA